VLSRPEYGERVEGVRRTTVHPAIGPLAEKTRPPTDADRAAEDGRAAPLSPRDDAPPLVQVSRFDPRKHPLGVVETYRRVPERVDGTRLAPVGGMPDDDPEGVEVYREVREATADDPDVHLVTDQPDATVDHLQRDADVVLRERCGPRSGSGLPVPAPLRNGSPDGRPHVVLRHTSSVRTRPVARSRLVPTRRESGRVSPVIGTSTGFTRAGVRSPAGPAERPVETKIAV
jgi:trehalose synthase